MKTLKKYYKKQNKTYKIQYGSANSSANSSNAIAKPDLKCKILDNEETMTILKYFFGISTTTLQNIEKYNIKKSKNNEHSETNTNLYYGRNNNNNKKSNKILNNTINFKLLHKIPCSFIDCGNKDIRIYSLYDTNIESEYIVIYFPIGGSFNFTKLVSLNQLLNDAQSLLFILTLISYIINYIIDDYKILLCGHSNGMSSAIFISYILQILCVSDDTRKQLPKHHDVETFLLELNKVLHDEKNKDYINVDTISNININIDIIDKLRDNIFICGTGGFPILWTKKFEFDLFNEFYKGKFIHIISAGLSNDIILYDTIAFNKITENNTRNHKLINTSIYKNFGSIVLMQNTTSIECFQLDFNEEDYRKLTIPAEHIRKHLHNFKFYRKLYQVLTGKGKF